MNCLVITALTPNQQVSLYVINHTDADGVTIEHLGMNLIMVGF